MYLWEETASDIEIAPEIKEISTLSQFAYLWSKVSEKIETLEWKLEKIFIRKSTKERLSKEKAQLEAFAQHLDFLAAEIRKLEEKYKNDLKETFKKFRELSAEINSAKLLSFSIGKLKEKALNEIQKLMNENKEMTQKYLAEAMPS